MQKKKRGAKEDATSAADKPSKKARKGASATTKDGKAAEGKPAGKKTRAAGA